MSKLGTLRERVERASEYFHDLDGVILTTFNLMQGIGTVEGDEKPVEPAQRRGPGDSSGIPIHPGASRQMENGTS